MSAETIRYLDGEAKAPPYAYLLLERCASWGNVLPSRGGLLDQDEALMQEIESAKNGKMRWAVLKANRERAEDERIQQSEEQNRWPFEPFGN